MIKLWLKGKLLLICAKLEGFSDEDIHSGLLVMTVNELQNCGVKVTAKQGDTDNE